MRGQANNAVATPRAPKVHLQDACHGVQLEDAFIARLPPRPAVGLVRMQMNTTNASSGIQGRFLDDDQFE